MSSDYRMDFLRAVEEKTLFLEAEQHEAVVDVVTRILADYEITERCTEITTLDTSNERILKRYLACMMVDGKSERTAYQYRRCLTRMSDFLMKPYADIGVYEIRYYLACEKERGISNSTLDHIRSMISAFFNWMVEEELIPKNPIARMKPIKCKKEIKQAFSDIEIDALRSACKNLKERALIEVLLSSGVRVSELSSMELMDIDFSDLSVKVKHGKGNKERITYITPVAATHLKKYIMARTEEGPMLFYNGKHQQLNSGGIRFILNSIAERAGVENVHPHRFRRTFATGLAHRGMEIQEIQRLLGHAKLDTTLVYVCTDEAKVASSYRRYIA